MTALEKTDEKDRHVLAAAIASNADMIVTDNIKDFDRGELSRYNVEINTADEFLSNQLDLHPTALNVVEYVIGMIKPPKTIAEYVERLNAAGLSDFAASFQVLREQHDQWRSLQIMELVSDENVH